MNILYVPSWFISRKKPSNGIFFYEQAKAISKFVDNIFIVYQKEIESNPLNLKNEKNIHFYPFPKLHYKRSFFLYDFLNYYVKKIIKKYGKIDLIHAQSFFWAGVESAKISMKYNIPLIITEHHSRFLVGKEKLENIKVLQKTIENSSKVVFVSNALKDSFITNILHDQNYQLSKFLVIPNLVPDDFFKNLNEKSSKIYDDIDRKFKIDKSKFIFSTIANLKPSKGFDLVIDSFYEAFSKIKNLDKVVLLIGGEGSYRNSIQSKIEKYNLKNNIILLGQLSRQEVEYILENSDCFVYGSEYETFGVVLAEALAKGVSVITTDCKGPIDFINETNGIIVKERKIDEFSNALLNIYNNKNRFDKEKIKQFAFENLSETAFIERYKKLYEQTIIQR
ncbi:MAG: glycosyltransferase [Exilispira sp.]|jgi:glycosyltransferase involved in cell wall biosynthesis|nr:glycosyltransferase [Exilispira sp.]